MKLSSRHVLAAFLFATSAVAAACGLASDEATDPIATLEAAPAEEQAPAADVGISLEGQRPISDAELAEVQRAAGLPATLEILTEDGETIKLESGITSMHEGSLNGVDITFTPLDANGQPSRKNLEVVYQRSDTAPARFYFVTDSSVVSTGAPELGGKEEGGPTAQCLGGNWTSWSTYNTFCGYRWLCSKKKWDHWATFEQQVRSKRCWNGTLVVQYRDHYAHCGC